MSQQKPAAASSSLNLQDILYVLFRHKWKILICSALGLSAAAAVFFLYPTMYESQAKLLVRYVVDTSAIDQVDSRSTGGPSSANLINSEVEILKSSDLAVQVVNAVGMEQLVPKGDPEMGKALRNLQLGLNASALRESNIITISYRNEDPKLTIAVLKELLTRYFTKHLEVHRSADAFNFVSQQTDQVRAQLNKTEDALKKLKDAAGVVSLEESIKTANADLAKTREALNASEAERAEQQAVVLEMEKPLPGQEKELQGSAPVADSEVVQRYQTIVTQLAALRESDLELVSKYAQRTEQSDLLDEQNRRREIRRKQESSASKQAETTQIPTRRPFVGAERDEVQALARERYRRQNDTGFSYQGGKKSFDELVKEAEQDIVKQKINNALVFRATDDELSRLTQLQKLKQTQIDNLEKQRRDLELKHPGLSSMVQNSSLEDIRAEASNQRARLTTIVNERARLAGTEAKTEALKSHLDELQKQAAQLAEVAPQIERLERTKQIEENNYKYFQVSLEKARVDEALDPSKMPNISIVQSPSIAAKTSRDVKKILLGLAGGGIAVGLAFAFLMELLLDRTVKRPLEIEMLLGAPPMLSIPYFGGRSRRRASLAAPRSRTLLGNGNRSPAPWEAGHFIRTFSEAIRDRLILYFLLNRLNHKPKLVAVTGCSQGAGTSTVAAGLAAALSETGEGKVLIVDMNIRGPEVHPFFRGVPACSLTEALVGAPAAAGENLYLATAASPDAPDAQIIPKKFYDLVPHLKASDFDYIIFDMPPLSQTSITLSIAGVMDKVLVLVDGEKSDRDFLKRAYAELIACRATVSIIFNKARSYMPRLLGAEG